MSPLALTAPRHQPQLGHSQLPRLARNPHLQPLSPHTQVYSSRPPRCLAVPNPPSRPSPSWPILRRPRQVELWARSRGRAQLLRQACRAEGLWLAEWSDGSWRVCWEELLESRWCYKCENSWRAWWVYESFLLGSRVAVGVLEGEGKAKNDDDVNVMGV